MFDNEQIDYINKMTVSNTVSGCSECFTQENINNKYYTKLFNIKTHRPGLNVQTSGRLYSFNLYNFVYKNYPKLVPTAFNSVEYGQLLIWINTSSKDTTYIVYTGAIGSIEIAAVKEDDNSISFYGRTTLVGTSIITQLIQGDKSCVEYNPSNAWDYIITDSELQARTTIECIYPNRKRRNITAGVINSIGMYVNSGLYLYKDGIVPLNENGERVYNSGLYYSSSDGWLLTNTVPKANNSYNLGTSTKRFKNLYLYDSPNVASKKENKENLKPYDSKIAYESIKNLDIYTANLKNHYNGSLNGTMVKNTLTVLQEDLGKDVVVNDGIDLLSLTTFAIAGLKRAIDKIEELEDKVKNLEK